VQKLAHLAGRTLVVGISGIWCIAGSFAWIMLQKISMDH